MELQTAIEILEYHQEWRLGKRENMIHEPKKLTEALDIVLNEVKKNRIGEGSGSLPSDIRDEMDADMEDSGMAQGEIESCLTHWSNKYVIQRKEWFSNDR